MRADDERFRLRRFVRRLRAALATAVREPVAVHAGRLERLADGRYGLVAQGAPGPAPCA